MRVLSALKCYCSWKSEARKTILWLTSALLVCKTDVRRDKTKFRTLVYLLSGWFISSLLYFQRWSNLFLFQLLNNSDSIVIVFSFLKNRSLPRNIMTSAQDNELSRRNIFDTLNDMKLNCQDILLWIVWSGSGERQDQVSQGQEPLLN